MDKRQRTPEDIDAGAQRVPAPAGRRGNPARDASWTPWLSLYDAEWKPANERYE
ncbi:MAG: hypothetical protein ACYC18_08490 [Gammaproteobacteria bacterium]